MKKQLNSVCGWCKFFFWQSFNTGRACI